MFQVLVSNKSVPYLHRFYIVLALDTLDIIILLFCKREKFKKPYSMRVCYVIEKVRHGYFNVFQD